MTVRVVFDEWETAVGEVNPRKIQQAVDILHAGG
ncbi:MAG: hypothetical protein QOG50_3508, partial [Actinomycetota bacterium]|nr:hypothetical protein [Actinomycetota bacterium]